MGYGFPILIEEKDTSCKSTFSDIVINGGLIIDTKYKYNSGLRCHFHNDDAYQILAYKEINTVVNDQSMDLEGESPFFIAPNALLLYPKVAEDFTWRHFVDESSDNKFFVSCVGFDIDIKKDLKSDKSKIIIKLRALIDLAQRPSFCPKCHSKDIVEIIYGYPSSEAWELEAEGKLALGGCIVDPENPSWYCNDCENKF